MPGKKVNSLRCPTCRELVTAGQEHFPFCSDRCRLIDLGKWASGGYVISSPITDPEDIERVQKSQEGRHRDDDNHDRNIH